MELSIIIPIYNESDNVSPLIDEIGAELGDTIDYEIVIVDDGSDDDSPRRFAELCLRQPRLRIIRHESRAGQSAALLTGVLAAAATQVITLDGDGQNPPAEIPRMLAAARAQSVPALVAGIRRVRHDGRVRRWSSRIANGIRSRLLRDDCPDTGCGLKLFDRETFLAIPRFDHMHRFMPALFKRAGCAVVLLEVDHRPRIRGRSKYGVFDRLWVGIVDIAGVMWLNRRLCRVDAREVSHDRY